MDRAGRKRELEGWTRRSTSPGDKPARETRAPHRQHRQAWIDRREPVGDGARGQAGDILVLVRQRGPLFEAIIRALKEAHVEVAGADRLMLTEHIAVMDLIALADALLLPQDDLALASVLKSPLFGLTEEQLFTWPGSARARCAPRCGRRRAISISRA
jgi:ATP-dependent helicase/nuclease subunit A